MLSEQCIFNWHWLYCFSVGGLACHRGRPQYLLKFSTFLKCLKVQRIPNCEHRLKISGKVRFLFIPSLKIVSFFFHASCWWHIPNSINAEPSRADIRVVLRERKSNSSPVLCFAVNISCIIQRAARFVSKRKSTRKKRPTCQDGTSRLIEPSCN